MKFDIANRIALKLGDGFMYLRFVRIICEKMLMPLTILSFAAAGYFLTYHLFFISLPLEDVAKKKKGDEHIKFRYDGVVYFNGFRLDHRKPLVMKYRIPRAISLVNDKKIEFFIRCNDSQEVSDGETLGKLVYTLNGKSTSLKLKNATLQRFIVPWNPRVGKNNTFRIKFLSANPELISHINFASNLRQIDLLFYFIFFLLLASALLAVRHWKFYKTDFRLAAVILACITVMYTIHSGAFISNDYFSGNHGKISSMAGELKKLLTSGHFSQTMYRGAGFTLISAVAGIMEGEITRGGLLNTYPTTRYLMFVWVALSLSFLITVLRRWIRTRAILIFGLLYATFYPFIVDMYAPDADAFLIPLMTLMVALFLRLCLHAVITARMAIAIGVVFAIMLSVKITPVFIAVLIPFALWGHSMATKRKFRDKKAIVVLVILLFSAFCGNLCAKAFQHPERNVGQTGVAFQDNVMWHILWAGYGLYDHHSAHWFTKSNKLRKQRVEESTGLSSSLPYSHQSQLATDKLYKPGVIRTFKERPGYFYSTAFIRFYNHALAFYRYRYGGGRVWEPWLTDGFKGTEIISGKVVDGLSTEREMTRYGKMWKLSPLVLLTKFVQSDLTRLADALLILCAIAGILSFRRFDIIAFFLGCVLAKYAFTIGFHALVRYMNFINVILLIGLCITLDTCIEIFIAASRKVIKTTNITKPINIGETSQ